ncbi:MAG: protein kinase [Acidobacteria bacterium]|nr:protein kinase [Acidobacteriota bacterium]
MTLSTGTRLSHFEINSQIGKGGMGEVYQAKDTKLGRDVAIKVLPEEFARDADRVARFQREAKLLASLNHPNIAAIHGLEEAEGIHFLVLELIEGKTLDARIKAGAIPVEEALKLALQIAEALEAAHDKGMIHRDLKPANIKVTPDGKVKVLDFGLAKAFAGEQGDMNLSNSPTLSQAATMQGVILGTAAYMSPEQARGKTVDKRTDIWAFGCVLYEMLTRQPAFQGEDVTEILAAVVKSEVNLDLLPANIHPRVREVITRCLQKEQKRRYSNVGDTQYEIEQVLADKSGVFVQPATTIKPRRKVRLGLPWIITAIVLTAIIAGVAVWKLKPGETRQVASFYYELPKSQQLGILTERVFAISPDGSQLVYGTDEGLYLRSMAELNARLISGTEENPRKPFFSPDGQWIGYIAGSRSELKKISINGGAPVPLSPCNSSGFFSWRTDDSIVYADGSKIMKVSANGGNPETIIELKEGTCIAPQILPDGKTVMYTLGPDPFKIMVQSLESGERKELVRGDTAMFLPTGHIVYAVDRNLFAVPFDPGKLKVTGGPIPMEEGILRLGGAPQYAVSESGMLVYIPRFNTAIWRGRTLVWVDRNDKEAPIDIPPNIYFHPRISPDGIQVAVCSLDDDNNIDTFIWNLAGETLIRLTSDPAEEDFPLWTPDGKRIVFYSDQGDRGIYMKSADGTGSDDLIRPIPQYFGYPGSWSSDGKTLITQELWSGIFSIGALSMEGDRKWEPLLQGNFSYSQPEISPNGKWLAYTSNESGRNEIFVRPYPEVESGKWPVSNSGGDSALWSPDGRELYYRNGNEVMAVPVKTDPVFSKEGNPKVLFEGNYDPANFTPGTLELHPWDISRDGKRFLMLKPPTGSDAASTATGPRNFVVVLNWFEKLKDRVPVD